MTKFKTKSVEIDAIEFTGNNFKTVQNFCGVRYADANKQYPIPNFDEPVNWWPALNDATVLGVVYATPGGWQPVRAGDYVIKLESTFEVCTPQLFEAKYEPV